MRKYKLRKFRNVKFCTDVSPPVDLPVITQLDPSSTVIAERGDSIVFSCNGTGLGRLTVTWSTTAANQLLPNASDVLGDSSIASRLSLPAVNVTDGGTYTCEISNEAGSATVTTGLHIVPEFLSQPFNITTSAGVTRSLTCLAVGFPEPTYHWEKVLDGNRDLLNMSAGGSGLMDEFGALNVTSRELNFDPVSYGDFGVYRCVVFNVAGMSVSDRATVAGTTSHKHTHARTHAHTHAHTPQS